MKSTSKNYFVLEGIDGSGKSTVCSLLKEKLGNQASFFFEPTDKNEAGRQIRTILRTEKNLTPQFYFKLLHLFYEDRLWNLENQVKPALSQGSIVIQDRYFFSTAAYQAPDRESCLSIAEKYLADNAILMPEKFFFLDISPELALERINARAAVKDIFETQDRLQHIAGNYRNLWQVYQQLPLVKIDANQKSSDICDQILAIIHQ